MSTERVTTWQGAYSEGWAQGDIVESAFSHPAKYSKSLIFRIIQHLVREGYVHKGDTVLDPFGGVALGALPCMTYGLQWLGCELEPRFHALGQENLALWRQRYGFTGAQIVCGDSRRLREVLSEVGGVEACVSSPPFIGSLAADTSHTPAYFVELKAKLVRDGKGHAGSLHATGDYGSSPGQLGAMPVGAIVSSPPYSGNEKSDYHLSANGKTRRRDEGRGYRQGHGCFRGSETYGQSDGQLGSMPVGDCVVSSPPFAASTHANHSPTDMTAGKGVWGDGSDSAARVKQDYAPLSTPGNLAGMVVEACVSSPPFMAASSGGGISAAMRGEGTYDVTTRMPGNCYQPSEQGTTAGNLAASNPGTFWSAASTIVGEVVALLKPGGVAVWVLKDYVSKGKIVPFCAQWRQLCESHGLVLIETIHASLVESHGVQTGLFGEETVHETRRESFFRKLHRRKYPHLAIDHETVLLFSKP